MDLDGFISVVLYTSSMLACHRLRLCSPKGCLTVRLVCPMYCEERVVSFFKHPLQLIM